MLQPALERIREAKDPDEPTRLREAAVTTILESLDDDAGWVWRVTMVRPGTSRNGFRYSREVLSEAASRYEGAKSFDGHRSDEQRRASAVAGLTGWHENVAAGPEGELQSDYHISEAAPHIRSLFLDAHRRNRPDLIGFSHDVSAVTAPAIEARRRIKDVKQIVEVHSVDVVADPSAGGKIERLVASTQPNPGKDGSQMDPLQKFLEGLSEDQQAAAALLEGDALDAFAAALGYEAPAPANDDGVDDGTGEEEKVLVAVGAGETDPAEVAEAIEQQLNRPGGVLHTQTVERLVEGTKLPEEQKVKLRARLENVPMGDLEGRVTEAVEIWDDLLKVRPKQLPGQNQVVQEAHEKNMHRLDAMFHPMSRVKVDGVNYDGFTGLREAYQTITGRPQMTDMATYAHEILAESVGAVYSDDHATRITEALTSTSWAEVLGDSVTRALQREYAFEPLQSWRNIVSDIVPISDFRTQRRGIVGGYNVLPSVAEAGAYTALTSPTDVEATYGITKYGGTETLTLEIIANDDLGALRRIPVNLGRAAALTLYRAIWLTTIESNATYTADTTALFDATHNNTTAATPLAEAGLATLRRLMKQQTKAGETSGFLGLTPRFVVVPSELWLTAVKLVDSAVAVTSTEDSTVPNAFGPSGRNSLEVIEVPLFSDANDWFLVADPSTVPTLEVGFYQGRQEPELFVQDQPSQGSTFTNDQILWKIRHIWGIGILDYRGFQRATNV